MKSSKNWLSWIIASALVITFTAAVMPLRLNADPTVETKRIAGDSRTLTAVEISKEGWSEGSDSVILARGDKFPDALAGAVLAEAYEAPILLTDSKTLTAETAEEIERLEAKTIYILGGTGAISAEIETALSADYTVERISGDDRYETAANIAKHLQSKDKLQTNKAVNAYAQNFPDALAISSWAAQNGVPILLSETAYLPEATTQALSDLEITETIITGGTGVISAQVESELPEPTRYGGNNRYETAINIIEGLGQSTDTIFVATGSNFPDALAGSALAAKQDNAILLVSDPLDRSVKEFLAAKEGEINKIYVLGGSVVVMQATLDKIVNVLSGIVEESPEEAVSNAFDALKALDEATVDRYFSYEEFMDYDDENNTTPQQEELAQELAQLFLEKLHYKIVSSSINGDTATVKAEITNTDMGLIFEEYMDEVIQLAIENALLPEDQQLTDEEIEMQVAQILLDLMEREDNQTVTTTVDINLTRNNASWKITMDEKLQDAILGGFLSALQDMLGME
jgi:putative cell wall-binding protein